MTIIKPNIRKRYKRIFSTLCLLVVGGGLLYVIEYNSLVAERSRVGNLKNEITDAKKMSDELKNTYYQVTDLSNLKNIAVEQTLVLEYNPLYISSMNPANNSISKINNTSL